MVMLNANKEVHEDGVYAREFPMSKENFQVIRALAYRLTGIQLSDHKQNMIYGRLARRLRALQLNTFDQYCQLLEDENSPEITSFVNAITTNLTAFFREIHHFEFLKDELVPLWLQRGQARRLRIWSAGCSTGEEPYSIAMVLSSIPALKNWDVKILATDLDTNVVDKAKEGYYGAERLASIPDEYQKFALRPRRDADGQMHQDLRQLITFKQLNLLHDWPMKGPFDLIFCRNVVIYFDAPTQRQLFDRYANILAPNAHLFVGHSENLHKTTDRFTSLGRTMYRKTR